MLENKPLSLILRDIDFFKAYNYTDGHIAGDDCLQQVAKAINSAVRRPGNLVARYGGEELAVILPNTETAWAIHLAEAIQVSVKEKKILHSKSFVNQYVTMSLGATTTLPSPDKDPKTIIAAADKALYQAKELSRDKVVTI